MSYRGGWGSWRESSLSGEGARTPSVCGPFRQSARRLAAARESRQPFRRRRLRLMMPAQAAQAFDKVPVGNALPLGCLNQLGTALIGSCRIALCGLSNASSKGAHLAGFSTNWKNSWQRFPGSARYHALLGVHLIAFCATQPLLGVHFAGLRVTKSRGWRKRAASARM